MYTLLFHVHLPNTFDYGLGPPAEVRPAIHVVGDADDAPFDQDEGFKNPNGAAKTYPLVGREVQAGLDAPSAC
jgi:hypothetical protein